MSTDEQAKEIKEKPSESFEAIGSKVENLAPFASAADDEEFKAVDEIESLCMNCGKNGITRILLTAIPYFREVVIMSFACDHCNLQNNEIQAAGRSRAKATAWTP